MTGSIDFVTPIIYTDSKMKKRFFQLLALFVLLYVFLPFVRNTGRESASELFDVIIVLGNPANADGSPSKVMTQRVSLGVDLYNQGVAPDIIFTGGAAANEYVESDIERQIAMDMGVPEEHIITERMSMTTYQNAYFATKVMEQHGYESAAIVSSSYHLRRVKGIFSNYDIEYRTFGCGNPEGFWKWCHDLGREQMILCFHSIFGYPKQFML